MFARQVRIQLVNGLFFAVAIALAFTPVANLLRWVMPIAALATAAVLLLRLRRADHYVSFCLWLFLMTPLVRRIVDYHTAWDPIATILLSPYLALALSAVTLPRVFNRKRRMDAPAVGFLLIFLSTGVGLLVALASGRYLTGGFDYIRWVLPPVFGIFLWTHRRSLPAIQQTLVETLMVTLPIMGVYGFLQYVDIQPWDSRWLINTAFDPSGGVQYGVRVFSTINSHGSLGHAMVLAILLLLVTPSPLKWVAIAPAMLILALSLSRTSWVALMAGLAFIALVGPMRTKLGVAIIAAATFVVVPAMLVFPEMERFLGRRFDTLSQAGEDTSVLWRLGEYEIWLQSILDQPLGVGLGAAGVYLRSLTGAATNIIDGGPIEVFQALGIGFGTLYLVGMLLVLWAAFRKHPEPDTVRLMIGCRAVMVAQVVAFWSWTTTTGEAGYFLFIAIGLALAIAPMQTLEDLHREDRRRRRRRPLQAQAA